MQFQEFQFNISTVAYNELNRVSRFRWASHDIVGGHQKLQATGKENDRIRLNGTFYPLLASQVGGAVGTQSLDALRELANQMLPHLLTAANGNSLGYWVLEELETTQSLFSGGAGVPQKQDFNIVLRWYGENL